MVSGRAVGWVCLSGRVVITGIAGVASNREGGMHQVVGTELARNRKHSKVGTRAPKGRRKTSYGTRVAGREVSNKAMLLNGYFFSAAKSLCYLHGCRCYQGGGEP
jgi:hypothetical protein